MPILKHRLELQGISHVVSLVSFSDVKAFEENNFTRFTPKRRLNHRRVFRCSLYTANKYRLRYVGVIYRLRHGCGRNGVSQAIVVKLRYGGYDLTEYGSV